MGVFQRLAELLQNTKVLPASASQLHPLDPLTADEITVAAKVCRKHAEKEGISPLRFNAITLQVPKGLQPDSGLKHKTTACKMLFSNGLAKAFVLAT